jgi:hypothetical protein
MKKQSLLIWKDGCFLIGMAFFFFGCIATTHRSAKTLEPGQFSLGAGYVQAENLEESTDSIQLVSVDARVGTGRGFDMGLMHTWDVTSENEGVFATFWGDCKWQLTNREYLFNKIILSTGLMKGYVYDEEAKFHITTLPVYLSLPLNERFTPYFIYRFELIGEEFIPSSLRNPRHTFALGVEANLWKYDPTRIMPKLGLSIGTMNSLLGGSGDQELIFNLGLSIDTPIKK